MPPIFHDSRQGPGTLTLKIGAGTAIEFGFQFANVALTPSTDEQDGTPTLASPTPLPNTTVSWALEGTAIQDWESQIGFVNWCLDNALATATFTWTPRTGGTPIIYSGTCQIQPVQIGGDVGTQITTDWSFPVTGNPTHSGGSPTLAEDEEADTLAMAAAG